jgi:hypothetical protein
MSFRDHIGHFVGIALLLLGATSCGYREPEPRGCTLTANAPIATLHDIARSGVGFVADNLVVAGVVTANDWGENFYQTIVIEDPTAAVELCVGLYDLHCRFPLGAEVVIDTEGLGVMFYDGVLQLGRQPYDYNPTRLQPLGTPAEVDRRVMVAGKTTPMVARNVVVGDLLPDECGRLVRFVGLEYVGTEPCWAATRYGTVAEREFTTPEGERLVVATSNYADFAGEKIPDGPLALSGILYCTQKEGGEVVYTLKLRTTDDVERL